MFPQTGRIMCTFSACPARFPSPFTVRLQSVCEWLLPQPSHTETRFRLRVRRGIVAELHTNLGTFCLENSSLSRGLVKALGSQGKPLPREESNEPATVLGMRRVCLRSTHWAFPCPENVNKSPSFAAVPHRQHVRSFGSIVKRTDDTNEHWTRTAGAGLCFGNLVLATHSRTPLEGTGQTASKSTRMFPLNKTHQCSVWGNGGI